MSRHDKRYRSEAMSPVAVIQLFWMKDSRVISLQIAHKETMANWAPGPNFPLLAKLGSGPG